MILMFWNLISDVLINKLNRDLTQSTQCHGKDFEDILHKFIIKCSLTLLS